MIIMGRTHYQGASQYFPGAVDDPYAAVLNAARKVVFSHTLATADWASTTVANGDLAAEIKKLKLDGDGYILADGGNGPRIFDGLEQPARLEFVSATPVGGGINELIYRPIR